jgi:hypothetical protein
MRRPGPGVDRGPYAVLQRSMRDARVRQRLPRLVVIWSAWILAAAIGSLLPIMPNVLDVRIGGIYLSQITSFSLLGGSVVILAGATCLALFQYVVLRVMIRRESLDAAMWIPASAIAAVAAFGSATVWQTTVPRHLLSISAIAAALPQGFPMVEVIGGLVGVVLALCLGLSQGIVLSKVLRRRVVIYWVLANVLGALVVGVVLGIREQGINDWLGNQVNPDEGTLTAFYVIDTILGGVLYAAVTGAALLMLAGRTSGTHATRKLVVDA